MIAQFTRGKTAKSFAGRCYELQIRFVDGSTRTALFKFK